MTLKSFIMPENLKWLEKMEENLRVSLKPNQIQHLLLKII